MAETAEPKGVVAVLTDDKGRVAVNAADFGLDGYGGYTLRDAQTLRVKGRIAVAFIRAYGSDAICKVTETYDAEQMVRRLCDQHGWKLTIIPIGYDDSKDEG